HIPLANENSPHPKGTQMLYSAGVTPKLWGNGKQTMYEKWNSYEVDFGDNIVCQKWGSGEMILQAGAKGLKIKIDPKTAKASYYTFKSSVRSIDQSASQ
ncbi:MAG: hypothetical protein H7Y07_01865, partial [Pyrinomonadaceae bacterium]|nr:hypothetical protein [Sphingobacteriaceae bacterium]